MNESWLNQDEGSALLLLARETIEAAVTDSALHDLPQHRKSPGLLLHLGAFVTLHMNDELRGCIGEMNWDRPVYQNVVRAAVGAALHDPRFYPLMMADLASVHISVSVLSPMESVRSLEYYDPVHHGIFLELHGRHAVFLPQVAREFGWDREQTLENLCKKGGMLPDAWRVPQAVLKVFTVQVFSERREPRS